MTVAVIGLGSMGLGAACSLVRAGFSTMGFDLRREITEKFVSEGGTAVESSAEAARFADVIFYFRC